MTDDRFEQAFAAHGRRVLHFALARTGSPYDAEDVAAETFARFLVHMDGVNPAAELAWLFKVAQNLCVDRARTRGKIVLVDQVPETGLEDPGLADAEVWDALGRLRPKEQQVVYLRAVEGRTYPEIGRLLGVRESAAKMRFRRAAHKLAVSLGGKGVEVTGLEAVDVSE